MTRNGTPTLEQPMPPAPVPAPPPPPVAAPEAPTRVPRGPRPDADPDAPDADDADPPVAPLGEIQLRDYEALVLRVHLLERYVVRLEGALAGRRGGP